MDRVYSTSNLPQRRWGSSVAQDQRSVRPTTASQRPISGRPVSGYGQRLSSRMQSRPTTALSAQKPPPLFLHEPRSDSSTQLPGHLRLGSAVRPLSGRIFMRKTQEKGWIAKNVPEVSYEGLEIEDYDDMYDDTQSVDSFFDDDFDTEEQDEKLQRLLTCTTLGVASKGHKQDYVSGDIAVPKFHCPRCRDHYYGLTPYPCDEELARLIREGLWRTGEGASPDKSIRHGMMRASLSETNIQKNRRSSSNKDAESSSKIKLPPLNTNNSNMTSSHDTNQSNKNGSVLTSKKRGKKISFALDNDSGASPSISETSLSGNDGSSNSKGRKRRIGDESKKGSLGSNKGSLTGLDDTTSAGSNSSLDRYRMAGHQKKSDNQSSTSKLIGNQTDVGILKDKGHSGNSLSGSNTEANTNNSGNALDDDKGHGSARGSGDMRTDARMGSNADDSSTVMLTDAGTMTNSDDADGTGSSNKNTVSNGSGSISSDGNVSTGSKHGKRSSEATEGAHGGGKTCNVVNCQNKTNSGVAPDGSDRKAHRAPPGYMRAASPSQSEWADPTHAKKWINNTAPPQPTFRYNNDNDDYDDEFSSQVFNPRGWRQQKKPSKTDADDPLLLPIGPTFTRAFTFSYMPGSNNAKSSKSNSAAGGSKKSRKKTT